MPEPHDHYANARNLAVDILRREMRRTPELIRETAAKTEMALAKLLRAHRIKGWRRHWPVFGRPDFVFLKLRVAIFVDGCFWHGCPKHSNMPVNNRKFWKKKLSANTLRDRLVTRTLRAKGWRVVRIWEHELRKPDRVLARIQTALSRAAGETD